MIRTCNAHFLAVIGGGKVLVGLIYSYYAGMLISMLQHYILSAMVMETNEMEGASYVNIFDENEIMMVGNDFPNDERRRIFLWHAV